MRRLAAPILALPLLLLGFVGCGSPPNPWEGVPGGPKRVLVSFAPLYCFAKQVAGPHAAVLCLATTVGPHHFEPHTDDALKASKADLILYNGLGLDDEKIKRLATSSGNTRVPVIAVAERAVREAARLKTEEVHHGDHTHPAGPDPHVWLGLDEAVAMIRVIEEALERVDPEHKAEFKKRADDYVERIEALRRHGEKVLKGKDAKIITMHKSLGYFARGLDLKLLDVIQDQPGLEADASKFKSLIDACAKEKCRIILTTEPQYPKTAAQALEKELLKRKVDVRLAEVDTIETADAEGLTRDPANPDADYYLIRMRKTIDNLAKAMD
jgi:zinc transport system substrate-binding protein